MYNEKENDREIDELLSNEDIFRLAHAIKSSDILKIAGEFEMVEHLRNTIIQPIKDNLLLEKGLPSEKWLYFELLDYRNYLTNDVEQESPIIKSIKIAYYLCSADRKKS